MSYLNKNQYDYRRESATQRNIDNESKATSNGMTEEQASLVSELCSLRHNIHSSIESLIVSDENNLKQTLIVMNNKLEASGLEPMSFIGTDLTDYVDIDDLSSIRDWDADAPSVGDEGYQEWYDENYSRIYDELEELNSNIESYLKSIDEQYNTSFAPTGALRKM
jgi:beta-mannanase